MTAKTVLILGDGPDAQLQRGVLATLPNAFRVVDGDADIVLVSGKDGNAGEALDRATIGSRAVFVTSPSFLDDAQRARLDNPEWTVSIALAYGASAFAADFTDAEPAAILDFVTTVADGSTGDLREALLAQLALSRVLMGEPAEIRTLLTSAETLVIEVSGQAGLAWRLSAHRGLRSRLTIDRVCRGVRHHVAIDPGARGRPAEVVTYNSSGTTTRWPVYQNNYRMAWSALAGIVESTPYTVAMLARDMAVMPQV